MFIDHNWIKVDINNKKITENIHNTCKLNTLLKNTCIEGKASKEIRKYCELKRNENIKYQNLWDGVKIVLQEKFMAINIYIRKKRTVSNQQSRHPLQENRKGMISKPRTSRRK